MALTDQQAKDVAARVIRIRTLRKELVEAETKGAKQLARDRRREISTADAEIEALIAEAWRTATPPTPS
jgi:hypothetical protein